MRDSLKKQFAKLRKDVGDDGSHYPACEKVVEEFWDYDEADREKAKLISSDFKNRREEMLKRRKKKAISGTRNEPSLRNSLNINRYFSPP